MLPAHNPCKHLISLNDNVFTAALGPLVSAPGSPSRLISLSQNTSFPLLPQLTGAVGSQVNHGPSNLISNNIVAGNNLNRVLPPGTTVPVEKSRLGETEVLLSRQQDRSKQIHAM